MFDKPLSLISWFLGFGVLYAVSAHIALSYLMMPNGSATIWPAIGVSLAALLLSPPAWWWRIALFLALIDFVSEITSGALPLIPGAIFSLSLTAQALTSAWLLRRYVSHRLRFTTLKEVFFFILLGAIVPTLVFAVPPALASAILLDGDFLKAWWWWSIPTAMGALIICPLILTLYPDFVDSLSQSSHKRKIELLGLLLLAILVTRFVFTTDNPPGSALAPYSYLTLPVLLLVAVRFNPSSVVLASFLLAATALWYDGHAPFGRSSSLLALETFLFVVISGALLFAALVAERRQAELKLLNHQRHLESVVAQRTLALEDANKELKSFSYSVSHDLRAPLRVISGFSDLLLESYGDRLDDTGKDYLERIQRGVDRMSHLIEDMLFFSMAARHEITKKRLDLSSLARKSLEQLHEADPDRTVDIDIQKQVVAWGDQRLLTIVMDNLIGNSWKYTAKTADSYIRFFTLRRGDELVYAVKDNGAGFDMKFSKNLFGAFQRLHSSADFEGSGIGLATVARIIHRHGGRVWAEAEVNQGATLYFTVGDPPAGMALEGER